MKEIIKYRITYVFGVFKRCKDYKSSNIGRGEGGEGGVFFS